MKMKLKRMLAILLAFAMAASMTTIGAFAEEGANYDDQVMPIAEDGAAAEAAVDGLAGMLSLDKYVVESKDTQVEFGYYGMFVAGSESDAAAYVLGDKDPGSLTVYADQALTTQLEGVTAQIKDGKLVVSGLSGTENTVCYITAYEGACTTIVYIVADEATADDELVLADGQTIAMNSAQPQNGTSDVYYGGNQGLFTADDYDDLDKATAEEKEVANWWLSAGITNAGVSLTEFGDSFHLFELSVYLYRNFQLMGDENMGADGFAEPTDYSGSMGSNDQFGDSVPITLYSGSWDGIYTEWNDEGKLVNIEGKTTMGFANEVDEETLLVSLYNTLNSVRACLTEKGEAIRDAAKAAAGENPDNAAKAAAMESALGIDYSEILKSATSQKLAVLTVLSKLDDCTEPIESFENTTLTDEDGEPLYVAATMPELMEAQAGEVISSDKDITDSDELTSTEITAAYINGGKVNITNSLITGTGSNSIAASAIGDMEFGAAGPYFTSGYNLTVGNAYYRYGLGSLLPVHGYDTVVDLTTTEGELLVSAPADGAMAGGLYNGFGGTINVSNGIVFSEGQHPSNTCYNGTIHYDEAAVLGEGRQYSSDFWGGYIVFENSLAVGVAVTDEPTTVIYKNAYTDMASLNSGSGGGISVHGYASMYFENSYVDNGYLTFQNNTSLITDTTSATLVNTVWNGESFGIVQRSNKAVITLEDSELNLTTGTILTAKDNITQNMMSEEEFEASDIADMYNTEAAIYIKGDVTINTVGLATFDVQDENSSITLYVKEIKGTLDTSDITVVYGDEYGTLTINSTFTDVPETEWYADYVNTAAANGLVNGLGDGTFAPTANLTRAQAAIILYRAMNLSPVENAEKFPDDNGADTWTWASEAIYACKAAGIINGRDTGEFDPDASITRAEIAAMVARALNLTGSDTEKFPDDTGTDTWAWAAESIYACKAAGIINGRDDGKFYPDDNITRAEMAKVAVLAFVEEELTITSYTTGENYVATAATENDWINSPSASSNITSVTLSDGTVVKAENGGVLTLIVNGDQYDILDYIEDGTALEEGTYSFAETAATTTYSEMAKFMNMAGQTAQYTFRAALTVNAEGIVDNETIPALLTKVDSYDNSGVKGGELNSYGAFFNGVIVDSATYSISEMEITAIGDGANDFAGESAVVFAKGTADVTIDDTAIITSGVIRTAAAVTDTAILRINNSLIYTQETEDTQEEYNALVVPMMKRTPMALGLEGAVRATNVLGAGQGIYTDSLIVSTGWGVLSTDSGRGYDSVGTYALDVSNVIAGTGTIEVAQAGKEYTATKTVDGVTYGYTFGGSGYVAYADSGVWDKFENVELYGGNEVQIMASSNSSAFYTNSKLTSAHIGVMTQQNSGGTISIKDSELNVGETGVQIKSGAANNGYTNVILDNTKVNFTADSKWGGTLVELVESDDAGNPGVTTYTINDTGDEATTSTASAEVTKSTALLANGAYTGNIWNNIYNKYQELDVTLENATVTGTISSSYSYHLNADGTRMENGTVLNADTTGNYLKSGVTDYNTIGAQYNVANEQVNNPINVTLTANSTWNVVLADGTNGEAAACYINDLTVEAGSSIQSETPVTIYVYGEQKIEGTVGENVKIEAKEYNGRDFNTNKLTAYDMADPRHTATFVFVTEDGQEAVNAAYFAPYKAFATSYFSLAYNSYELVSMEVTEGDATITEIKEGDEYYGEYDYNIAMNSDCTVTVTVKAASSGGGDMMGGGEMPPM